MKTFKLRMSLFRIWFMKNILVFLQIIAITLFFLVFFGVLPSNTPIFGKMIAEIKEMKGDASGWINTAAVLISCLSSIGIFMLKVKNIALSDIKNDKLKYAMIKAGLYFDEKGHLTKKLEKITNQDINGDGKIDDKDVGEAKVRVGFFSGLINAIRELFAIATVKIDETKTEDEALANALEETEMTEAAEGVKELDTLINNAIKTAAKETVEEVVKEHTDAEPEVVQSFVAVAAPVIEEKKETTTKKKKIFYKFKFRTEEEVEAMKLEEQKKKEARAAEKQRKADEKKKIQDAKKEKKSTETVIQTKTNTAQPTVETKPEPVTVKTENGSTDHTVNNFLKNLRR